MTNVIDMREVFQREQARNKPQALVPDAPAAHAALQEGMTLCSPSTRLFIVNELNKLNRILSRQKLPGIDYGK